MTAVTGRYGAVTADVRRVGETPVGVRGGEVWRRVTALIRPLGSYNGPAQRPVPAPA